MARDAAKGCGFLCFLVALVIAGFVCSDLSPPDPAYRELRRLEKKLADATTVEEIHRIQSRIDEIKAQMPSEDASGAAAARAAERERAEEARRRLREKGLPVEQWDLADEMRKMEDEEESEAP